MINPSSIRIGLSGANGKMGQSISQLVTQNPSFMITHRYDSKNPLEKWQASQVDVVIDFSHPDSLISVLSWCFKNKIPIVSGTTGLSHKEKDLLQKHSKMIPILWSPNMSLGIAVLNEWIQNLPGTIKNWDIQIQETHHKEKKDSPSGTALLLQNSIEEQKVQAPKPVSIRGGGVHGIHEIFFMGNEEVLSVKHFAQDRKVFARGALTAGRWLINQSAGLYSIKNCL